MIEFAERVPSWSVVVGLIGSGQEINVGEEGGIGQRRDAIERSAEHARWTIPPLRTWKRSSPGSAPNGSPRSTWPPSTPRKAWSSISPSWSGAATSSGPTAPGPTPWPAATRAVPASGTPCSSGETPTACSSPGGATAPCFHPGRTLTGGMHGCFRLGEVLTRPGSRLLLTFLELSGVWSSMPERLRRFTRPSDAQVG